MNKYKPMNIQDAVNLANPPSWAASAIPSIFGVICCGLFGYSLAPWKAVFLVLACILLQACVNTINDYMDFEKGTDTTDDCLEASDAVLLYGGIDPKSALRLGIGYGALGCVLGIIAAYQHGLVPLIIGAIGAAIVALYSCGPVPISYLPFGELISGFVMGGLIPVGVCACADGRFHPVVLLCSLPLITGIGLIMMTNNGSDIEKDIAAGRKTFPVVVGRQNTVAVYKAAVVLWMAFIIVLPVWMTGIPGLIAAVLVAIPLRKFFVRLLHFQLVPADRIKQMKGIAAANMFGNGAYCLVFLIGCIVGLIHG